MTRILFVGDLAPTGFGTVTADLGREMLALGEDVRFLSSNELGDLPEPFKSRTFVVSDRDGWQAAASRGKLGIAGIIDGTLWPDGWNAEAVIVLGDFYGLRGIMFMDEDGEAAFRKVPTLHYSPIEGTGLPLAWRKAWEIASPVAMSEFGADEIAKVMGTRPPVVYHGVDTASFWPVSAKRPIRLGKAVLRSKADAKAYFKIPEGVQVLLRADTNFTRKRYPSLMRSLAPVLASHPDTWLLMHCRSSDDGGDIRDTRSKFRPEIAHRMVSTGFHDHGFILNRPTLNALYNAADVYVSVSSEGFGLTLAEAIACGVPAVGMDYSAVPEVIGPAGRVVPIMGVVDNQYGHFWGAVDEPKFGEAVSALLDNPRERALLGAKGPFHVTSNFSWPKAAAQFRGLVEQAVGQEMAA